MSAAYSQFVRIIRIGEMPVTGSALCYRALDVRRVDADRGSTRRDSNPQPPDPGFSAAIANRAMQAMSGESMLGLRMGSGGRPHPPPLLTGPGADLPRARFRSFRSRAARFPERTPFLIGHRHPRVSRVHQLAAPMSWAATVSSARKRHKRPVILCAWRPATGAT